MKALSTFLLAVSTCGFTLSNASAQSTMLKAERDSLWAVWTNPAQADTDRLNAIKTIAWSGYQFSQPDSAFYYAQLQYDLATSKGLKKYMAVALNIQGNSFMHRGDYPKALAHYQRSLTIREEIGDRQGIASSLNNIGNIYYAQGDFPKALAHYQRSIKTKEETGDKSGASNTLNNIGAIYELQGDHTKALELYQRNLGIFAESGDKRGISISLNNIGGAYHAQGDYSKALDHHQRSLKISEEIGNKQGMSNSLGKLGTIYQDQNDYSKALGYFKRSLEIKEEVGDISGIAESYVAIGELKNKENSYRQALVWCAKCVKMAEELGYTDLHKQGSQCLYNAYKALGKGNEALVYLEKIGELDKQLSREETTKQLDRMEFQKVMLQDSIAKAEEARLVQETHQEEVRQTTRTRYVLIVAGSFFMLLAVGFYGRMRYVRKSRDIITKERDRSDNLLLNILPEEIAAELKEKGRADARDIELVSILFTDFKDFTEHSANMPATALVKELNHCFEAFDGIMTKYGIEKIKTIGDAYMAAGGLPVPTDGSAKNTVLAALEMQTFIRLRKAENAANGEPAFEMRVGIHTGPVVAGIVGVKKFQYDIWGDTVNTASRMESSGEVGQVNISETTYGHVKNEPGLMFTPRGKVQAKGKGEMEMYFVAVQAPPMEPFGTTRS